MLEVGVGWNTPPTRQLTILSVRLRLVTGAVSEILELRRENLSYRIEPSSSKYLLSLTWSNA